MKKQKKNQKPIDYDLHLKYLCSKCGQEHWLSLREASTPDYKVVCFCDHIFTVKTVEKIKIKYKVDKEVGVTIKNSEIPVVSDTTKEVSQIISPSLYHDAAKLLIGYGFTKAEANEMVVDAYNKKPCDDYKILVQTILSSLEVTDGK